MLVTGITNQTLSAIAADVAKSLGEAVETPGGWFIRTPLVYPSGTTVVVRIDGSKNRYFVSDIGAGYQEAMMINASLSYGAIARALIRDTAVSFDNRSFFVAESEGDEVVDVVGAIANCSQRAVIETALKHEARKTDVDRATLISRLQSAFGSRIVEKDVGVRGASSVEWEVTARVISPTNVISLFDYARPHKNSVTSVAAKFHDIARLERAPRRIVTVRDQNEMGHYIGLLSQAATVIELSRTPDPVLLRLAA